MDFTYGDSAIETTKTKITFPGSHKVITKLYKYYQVRISNDSELSQALNYYVPAECIFKCDTKTLNNRHDLHNDIILPHIQNTSTQKSPVLLLHGDTGSGKSLYVNWLEKQLWELCLDSTSPIPILIELKHFKSSTKRKTNVNLIEDHLHSIGYDDSEILKLKNDFHTVIIFDGFDEIFDDLDDQISDKSRSIDPCDNLYLINQLHTWKARVIITCRNQYLNNHGNYADWFVYKPGAPLKKAEITPFHQGQIERYLALYNQYNPLPVEWGKSYLEIIKGLNGAFELITNPLILYMVLRSLKILLQRQVQPELHTTPDVITRVVIYEAFIQEWFERETQRRVNSSVNKHSNDLRTSFYKYCMRLAFKMFLRGQVSVTYQPLSQEPLDEYALEPTYEQSNETKQWEEFFSNTDPKIIQTRSGCPLRLLRNQIDFLHVDAYEYSFYHRSFLEYFAARHLYLTLYLDNPDPLISQRVIAELEKKPINEKLLKSEPGSIEFFAQMVQFQSHKLDRLLSIILASRNHPRISIAASNALTVLTKARFSFSNLDLSNIQAPGAVLDDMIADNTNFQGANLTSASLSQAWMRKADLQGCQLDDVQFGERPYLEFDDNVHCISASQDGKLLAVGIDRIITLWDIENMSLIKTFEGHAGRVVVISVALSDDGQLLVSGSENIRVWNTITGKCEQILTEHSHVQCLSLNTNKKLFASGSIDNTVRVWDINSASCMQVLKGHTSGITCVSISADGERVYSGSGDCTIRVWDVSRGNETCKIECSSQINSLAIISEGERFIAATSDHDNFVSIWDTNTGQCKRTLQGHTSNITAAAIDAAGEQLVSGGWDKTIRVWDISTVQCKKIIKSNPANHIHRLHLTANGKRLFSISRMSDDRTVRIWDLLPNNATLLDNHTSIESSIHISSDGKLLASGTMEGVIRIWNIASGQCMYTLTGHNKPVFSVIFSINNNILVSADQQSIRIWNLSNYLCIQTIHSKSAALNTISLISDSKQLASGDNNGIIRIWDTDTGQCKHVLYGHEGFVATLAFCNDGKRLVSGGRDHTIRMWNIQKGKCDILCNHNGIVDSISLSADNRCLVSADRESMIRIWDLDTCMCLKIINLQSYSHEFLNEDGSPFVVSRSNGSITFSIFSTDNYSSPFSFTQSHGPHLRTFSSAGGGAICLPLSNTYFNYVSINFNGTYLATASGDKVNIWKVATGKSIATFSTSSDIRRIHYYYPDTIAVCCEVSSLQLWRRVREKNQWYLAWSGHSRPLVLTDCQIDKVTFKSVSVINRMLLKQRKASIDDRAQSFEPPVAPNLVKLVKSNNQPHIDNLSSSKVTPASIMAQSGSSIFTSAPIVTSNNATLKNVASNDKSLPDWLTGDHISQISDAMIKFPQWHHLNRLIEFSPSIDLYADDIKAGSLKNTLCRKAQELKQKKPIPIFSFALNLSLNTKAREGQGCHWIYGMIIHERNKNKAVIINSLKENDYRESLLKVKTMLQIEYQMKDTDIEILNTNYQHDDFNCGIWILVLLERTLECLNIQQNKFINFSFEDLRKQLLLGDHVNANQFVAEKRKNYNQLYNRNVTEQIIPQCK